MAEAGKEGKEKEAPPQPVVLAAGQAGKEGKEKEAPPQPVVLAAGQVIQGHEIVKPLGKGKFSIVYMAKRLSDGLLCALKKINVFDLMQPKQREKCLKEVRLLQSLDHPNIVKLLEAIIQTNELLIIVDWAEKGDLKRLIRKAQQTETHFAEAQIWQYSAQLSGALAHMHGKRIMHRDLKPANIFVAQDGSLKLGDLGLGRSLSMETLEAFSKVGTPLYMSPEVLHGAGYDMLSDVWSLGCVIYELAMLRSPFKSDQQLSLYDLFVRISKGQYPPLMETLSSEFRQLATQMLALEAAKRPDASKLLAACQAHLATLAAAGDAAGGTAASGAAGGDAVALGQEIPDKPGEDPRQRPLARPSPLLIMEDIVEKLKLLECEERLLRPRGYPLFHRCFFSQQVPLVGELTQFEIMYELFRWLLSFQKAREERGGREETQQTAACGGQADASAGPCLATRPPATKAPAGRRRPGLSVGAPLPAGASMGAGDAAAGGLGVAATKPQPQGNRPPNRPRVRPEDAFDLTEGMIVELAGRGIMITSESTRCQLRQGFGEGVCLILNELINQELLAEDFHFDSPCWEEADGSEYLAEEVVDEVVLEPPSDDEERGSLNSDGEAESSREEEQPLFGTEAGLLSREHLLEPVHSSQVSAEAWQAELLRVRPRLQVQEQPGGAAVSGWRSSFATARQLCSAALALNPSTDLVETLRTWQEERQEELELLRQHEERLNSSLAAPRAELGSLLASSTQEAKRLDMLHSRVTELSQELAAVSQELDQAKQQTEAECEVLNNVEKLSRFKASLQRLKEEDKQLAVRVALAQRELLRRRGRRRSEEPTGE